MSYRFHYNAFGHIDGVDGDTGSGCEVDLSNLEQAINNINTTIKKEGVVNRSIFREQTHFINNSLNEISKELKYRNKIEKIKLKREMDSEIMNHLRKYVGILSPEELLIKARQIRKYYEKNI